MIDFFICLIISVMSGIGMAIVAVEKGKDFPIKSWRIRIQMLLRLIHWKMPQMLFCTTCTSFWTTMIADIIISLISYISGTFYFFWPFSGFISAGISWVIIELLNILDKRQDINILLDNNSEGRDSQ